MLDNARALVLLSLFAKLMSDFFSLFGRFFC
jgi:hypothetical protein